MGKNILITGATDGIGRQTALELARSGVVVIVHGRSEEKCREAIRMITNAVPEARLDYSAADLSSLAEVRKLAADIGRRYDALHVLINNAGVFLNRRTVTVDGYETTIAVNHLAPFLLTNLLLPLLQRSAPSRIVTVSSMAHARGPVDLDDLQSVRQYDGYTAYAMSKCANISFTLELAERLRGTGVTANCLHPGVVRTKLLRAGFGGMPGSETLSEGAATPVYLALSEDAREYNGTYIVRCRVKKPAAHAADERIRKQLWTMSEQLTNLR